jgi:hypothetical protein
MKVLESYIEKSWGESADNPSISDVQIAIEETKNMDEEHASFFVSVFGDEIEEVYIEVSKDLRVIVDFDPDNMFNIDEIETCAKSWVDVEECFGYLLMGEVANLKIWIENNRA